MGTGRPPHPHSLTPDPPPPIELSRTTCLLTLSTLSASATPGLLYVYFGNSKLSDLLTVGIREIKAEPSPPARSRTTQTDSKGGWIRLPISARYQHQTFGRSLRLGGSPAGPYVWADPHLFLSLQPAVHQRVIGAERGACRLSLEVPVIGPGSGVARQAAVRVQAFTLRRHKTSVWTTIPIKTPWERDRQSSVALLGDFLSEYGGQSAQRESNNSLIPRARRRCHRGRQTLTSC